MLLVVASLSFYMGESFQDFSWSHDFEAFPQKDSLKILNWDDFIFSLFEDNWTFKLEIVKFSAI